MEDAAILDLCTKLERLERGAQFYKVDLHVHSPGSFDFGQDEVGEQKKTLKTMDGADFVKAWLDRGVDVIAITDHNNGTFIDEAQRAAKAARRDGRRLHVLPGVEVTVQSGVHLLAIFPEGGSALVDDFLSKLGLPPGQRNRKDSLVDVAFHDVAKEVHARAGLLIGAHVDSTKGVVEELKGESRTAALSHLDCLEISTARSADPEKTIRYVRETLGYKRPFVYGSDSHNPAQGPDAMWVKMAQPSFHGLRQILFEPDLRIATKPPDAPRHPRIVGCTATHGIYASEMFGFSTSLNVLIGGRGAGKSALIDLLRFALGVEPLDATDRSAFGSRIAGFLQGIGEVVVSVITGTGKRYAVVRSGAYTPDRKASPQFSDEARVYQIMGDSVVLRDLRPGAVFPVEFYGQGEVANLTKRVDEQLRLIDDNLDLDDLKAQERANEEEAENLEDCIVRLLDDVAELDEKIGELPELRQRKKYLDKRLTDPIFKKHGLWASERALFQALEAVAKGIRDKLGVGLNPLVLPQIDLKKTPNEALVKKAIDTMRTAHEAANSGADSVREAFEAQAQTMAELKAKWDERHRKEQERFRQELGELGLPDLAAVAAERDAKQVRIDEIEQIEAPRCKEMRKEVKSLRSRRVKKVSSLAKVRAALREQREELVETLNNQLGGVVVIELDPAGDRSEYIDYVSSALDGSGMQNRASQVMDLCERMTPPELAAALRGGDAAGISEAGGLTTGNTAIILRHMTEREIMRIERLPTPALPNIKLRREGESKHSELENLSVGEQCSAILSIALLDKGKPLVIDQPEDELDHAFVTEAIVENIRHVKGERQIIAATHNPNIPVLGDAELIFRVSHRPGTGVCEVKVAGGIEEPEITAEVQMLEGGPVAFEKRRQKYEGRL